MFSVIVTHLFNYAKIKYEWMIYQNKYPLFSLTCLLPKVDHHLFGGYFFITWHYWTHFTQGTVRACVHWVPQRSNERTIKSRWAEPNVTTGSYLFHIVNIDVWHALIMLKISYGNLSLFISKWMWNVEWNIIWNKYNMHLIDCLLQEYWGKPLFYIEMVREHVGVAYTEI